MKELIAALFFLLLPIAAHADERYGSLTPQEVKAKLGVKNVYVFDNNAKERWQMGHVPGAKWLHPLDYEAKDLPADKDATLIFYCSDTH